MRKPFALLCAPFDAGANLARKLYWSLRTRVEFGRGVVVGRGCRFHATDGGRIVIGAGTAIYAGVEISAQGAQVSIGPRSLVNTGSMIHAAFGIAIGDDALIAEYVTIRDGNHRTDRRPYNTQPLRGAALRIGHNCWIAAKATVLADICDDAVVGANSVVVKPIVSPGIYVGAPAVRKGLPGWATQT